MGEYEWKSFVEVESLAASFSRGLKELGLTARKNVVIFAETREEWMIAAHACFKQNLTIVTIYSTLGDDAIAHGINETEVDTVITSHELLPKFKRLLQKVPEVKNIIYMEDQLKKADTKGYKVRIVCRGPSLSSLAFIPRSNKTPIITLCIAFAFLAS
jgi:long-chain acyl-CoA synthetase